MDERHPFDVTGKVVISRKKLVPADDGEVSWSAAMW